MPDTQRAERLIALFSSPECAEGIVGDLSEDPENKRSFSFWRDVLTTTVALSAVAVDRAPFATLRHAFSAFAGFVSFAFIGFAAVNMFPQLIHSPVRQIVLSLIWWSGALHAGSSVVRIGAARGLAACVGVAIVAEALLLGFVLTADRTPGLATLTIAALAPVFMLAGATRARIRMLARDTQTVEQSQ